MLIYDNGNPEIKFEGKNGTKKKQWLLISQQKKSLRRERHHYKENKWKWKTEEKRRENDQLRGKKPHMVSLPKIEKMHE